MSEFNVNKFIDKQVKYIAAKVGGRKAIAAVSFGVDSTVVAALASRTLSKEQLLAYFMDTGFMRKDEYKAIHPILKKWGLDVQERDCSEDFFEELECEDDPDTKRQCFKEAFYRNFGELIKEAEATHLCQGTIKADLIMTEKGQIQHNTDVPFANYGIKDVVEPLTEIYKPQVREVARALGLPTEISERQPFPGPGLLVRCHGFAYPEKIEVLREAQAIVEDVLSDRTDLFQVMAGIGDGVAGYKGGEKVQNNYFIFVSAWESKDAVTAKAERLKTDVKKKLESRILEIPGVSFVAYPETDKPPRTMELY